MSRKQMVERAVWMGENVVLQRFWSLHSQSLPTSAFRVHLRHQLHRNKSYLAAGTYLVTGTCVIAAAWWMRENMQRQICELSAQCDLLKHENAKLQSDCASKIDELCRLQELNHKLKEVCEHLNNQLWTVPTVEGPPDISADAYRAVVDVAWKYSMNGIEGCRQGHILVIGDSRLLLQQGYVKGRGLSWNDTPILVQSSKGREDLMMEMNFDGCHIIESDGRIVASRFFSSKISDSQNSAASNNVGGSGAAAAQFLSLLPGTVAIKISQDGAVTEYRGGQLARQYCGSRGVVPENLVMQLLRLFTMTIH